MRILGRKFYAYKSKNRRKNTPDSAFPRTLLYLTIDLSSSTQHHLPAIYTQIETAADAIHMKCQALLLFVNDENTYIIQVFYYGFHELSSASFTLETPIATAVVFRLKPVYFLTISL